MEILYLYRKDEWDSLKFSLRSLQHIKHGNVWVVGDRVPYDVNNIVTDRQDEKYSDSNHNFKTGVQLIGKEVLLMHDDMFLLPGYEPKKYYKGFLSDYPRGGDREQIFKNTIELCNTDINYGLHYPMPFINDFDFDFDKPVSMMSFLGSRKGFEAVESEDCKFNVPTMKQLDGMPCFSTYNETDDLKPLMLRLYPNKSIFE